MAGTTRDEMERQWTSVDDLIGGLLAPPEPVLEAALLASANAGMPPHHVAPN